jgi:hypothetical protein
MNESEWLACNDPTALVDFLSAAGAERKARLFACACYRRIHAESSDSGFRLADLEQIAEDWQSREGWLVLFDLDLDEAVFFNPLRFLRHESVWDAARTVSRDVLTIEERNAREQATEESEAIEQRIGDRAGGPVWSRVLVEQFAGLYRGRVALDPGTFRGLAAQRAWAAARAEVNVARIAETGAFRRWREIAHQAERVIKQSAREVAGKLGDFAGQSVSHVTIRKPIARHWVCTS